MPQERAPPTPRAAGFAARPGRFLFDICMRVSYVIFTLKISQNQ
jgi:hypothetical protein